MHDLQEVPTMISQKSKVCLSSSKNYNIHFYKSLNYDWTTSKNVNIVSNCNHVMPFYSSIRQLECSANCNPLKRFAVEIFFYIFGMSTLYFTGSFIKILFATILFKILLKKRSDDDIILASQLVGSSGVLLINDILFVQFEFEFILCIGFDMHVGFAIWTQLYYSSLFSRWLVTLIIVIYLFQLSHEPFNWIPSIKKLVVIFI